jgi:hypothetical protein
MQLSIEERSEVSQILVEIGTVHVVDRVRCCPSNGTKIHHMPPDQFPICRLGFLVVLPVGLHEVCKTAFGFFIMWL